MDRTTLQEFEDTLPTLVEDFWGDVDDCLSFSKCDTDAKKFSFQERYWNENYLGEPTVSFSEKSPEKAASLLKEAQKLLTHGSNLKKALKVLNEAIVLAPWRTQGNRDGCFPLVLFERAGVFLRKKRYAECIRDLELSMIHGCPRERRKELLMKKADAFLAANKPDEAIFCLVEEGSSLKVCPAGGVKSILALDGDMKDYASLLAWAFKKQRELRKKRVVDEPLEYEFPGVFESQAEVKKFSLKNGRNKAFPSASSVVKLEHTEELGRYFIARESLDPGDVVLIEPAFASSLAPTALRSNCYSCHLWTDSPYPCRNCASIIFCSAYCAAGPKAALHAKECSFWRTFSAVTEQNVEYLATPCNMGPQLLLAVRTLLMKTPAEWEQFMSTWPGNVEDEKNFSTVAKTPYLWDDYANVFALPRNVLRLTLADLIRNAFLSVFAMKVLTKAYFVGENTISSKLRRYLGGIVFRHLCNFTTCWYFATEAVASDKDESSVAIDTAAVVHPTFELFNYSCYPNLFAVHYGDVVVVRARRPIMKGEILTHPLRCEFTNSPLGVRKTVSNILSYDCRCQPCVENWPYVNDENRGMLKRNSEELIVIKCPYCEHVLGKLKKIRKELGPCCPKCKVSKNRIYNALTDAYDEGECRSLATDMSTPPETLFKLIQKVCTVFEVPNAVLVGIEMYAIASSLRRANRNFGDAPRVLRNAGVLKCIPPGNSQK